MKHAYNKNKTRSFTLKRNSWNLSTFSFLLEKPTYKNPCSFLYIFAHAQFVLILKWKGRFLHGTGLLQTA